MTDENSETRGVEGRVGRLEGRVSRLETGHAALNQRVQDLGVQVLVLAPLAVSAAELRKDVKSFEIDLRELKDDFAKDMEVLHQRISARDKTTSDDRRQLRTSLFALTAAVCAAVITALGGVLVAVITSQ